MSRMTPQVETWSGDFGKKYTDRCFYNLEEREEVHKKYYGMTRQELNEDFVGNLDRQMRILEVGSNAGYQLRFLQEKGFAQLYGIELQWYAVEIAKKNSSKINIIQGSAFDIPYKDGFFDMVFTSGVLIHIHPNDVLAAMDEIYRCTHRYIWGYEYFSETYEMVPYRGENLCWRGDFAKMYLDRFPDLVKVKVREMKYLENEKMDYMFLLEKR